MLTLPHRTSKGDAGLCATEAERGTIFGEARVVVYTQRGRMQGVPSQETAGAWFHSPPAPSGLPGPSSLPPGSPVNMSVIYPSPLRGKAALTGKGG